MNLATDLTDHALALLARAVRLEDQRRPAAAEAARQAALFYLDAIRALRSINPQTAPEGF